MKMSYDATNIGTGSTFPVAPEGVYMLTIREVYDKAKDGTPKKTRNGDPCVNIRCEIDNGSYLGLSIWNTVTFMAPEKKGSGMAIQFLKAIGQPHEGEFEIDTDDWVGCSFEAKVRVGKDLNGNDRNEIAFLIGSKDSEKEEEAPF